MKSSVRVVCSACLQSLDLAPDEGGRWPTLCPVCGGTVDSQFSDVSTPETRIEFAPPTLERDGHSPDHWARVWQEGSLGTFNRFQIREQLGDGGFGTVFRAYDPRLDRDVALKVLKQADPGERIRERFFREARAAARLRHPNIAAVHDSGTEDGRCWVVFDHIVGRPLSRWTEHQGKIEIATAVRIVRELAGALEHAHARGVYHRDLKPANVMMDENDRPQLIDFGLSRFEDIQSDLTHDGGVVGTPNYMSPEQRNGQSHRADGRSDLYSLGVVFYELLTGQRPVSEPSSGPRWATELNPSIIPVRPPRDWNREIPPAIERICLRAIDPDPTRRYQNARALIRDLDRWQRIADGSNGVSFLVATVILGIAGCILLAVGLKFALESRTGNAPASTSTPPVAAMPLQPVFDDPAPATPLDPRAVKGLKGPYYCALGAHSSKSCYHYFEECPPLQQSEAIERIEWREVTARKLRLCSVCENKWARQELRAHAALPR